MNPRTLLASVLVGLMLVGSLSTATSRPNAEPALVFRPSATTLALQAPDMDLTGAVEIDPAWMDAILSLPPSRSPIRIENGVASFTPPTTNGFLVEPTVPDPFSLLPNFSESQEVPLDIPLDLLIPEDAPVTPEQTDLNQLGEVQNPTGDPGAARRCWWYNSSTYTCCDYYGPSNQYYTCYRYTYECYYAGRYSQRCAWRAEEYAHKCS